jgi:CBS domain containing-hemolysin-like protein
LEDIGRAIELGTHDAALAKQEQSALQNLVNLAEMRIDECMRPRSQLLLVRQPVSSATLADQPPAGGYALVIENEAGEIVGSIGTLSLRPHHFDDLAAVIEPVCYVPWSASASSVLDLLHKQRISVAVVVNEFGESIGALSIEDIMRQVLTGRFEHVDFESQQPMETLGAGHYRVSGAMRLRKIAKLLEIPPPEGRTASIMGLMQRLNERPPRLGDTCEWDDYRLEVTAEQANGSCIIDIRHIDTIKDEPEPDVPSTQDTGMQAPDTPQEEPT